MSGRYLVVMLLLAAMIVSVPLSLAQGSPGEVSVVPIALDGPAAERDAEFSSLAWYGDTLFLMAENPNIYATEGNAGMFYKLAKDDLLAYLVAAAYGLEPAPLTPVTVPVIAPDIAATVPGFDGFEAVAFVDDAIYLMIEAEAPDGTMRGYLVKGTVEGDLASITLDLDNRVEIMPQTDYGNMSYESLFVAGDRLVTFYEINGAGVNAEPAAYVYDFDLQQTGDIPFPTIEYRVTDATPPDENGVFWAINYLFPGEDFLLTDADPLVEQFGEGDTHGQFPHVERLVELQYSPDAITLTGTAPVQLALPDENARNWEGITRLDDLGFLLVTDKYPQTILAFVPYAE